VIFLLDYDRSTGALVSRREFAGTEGELAEQARLELELQLLKLGLAREVVLLEAASQDDLQRTHRRYFEGLEQMAAGPHSVFADNL
jgi:hypothetical protein